MEENKADLYATKVLHSKFILNNTLDLLNNAGLQPDDQWVELVNRAIENRNPIELMYAYPQFYLQTCIAKAKQLGEAGNFTEGKKWAQEGLRMGRDAMNGRIQIVANIATAYVDYLVNGDSGQRINEYEAIAMVTNMMRPEPPKNWPNVSEEDRLKLRQADANTARIGSDGAVLLSAVNLCRHARSLTYDICEMRGMNPYGCMMKIENEKGELSGHALVVVFEDDEVGDQAPVFVDGHNGVVDRGIEALVDRWGKAGWKVTSCSGDRMVSRDEVRQKDGSISLVNSVWDTKQLI